MQGKAEMTALPFFRLKSGPKIGRSGKKKTVRRVRGTTRLRGTLQTHIVSQPGLRVYQETWESPSAGEKKKRGRPFDVLITRKTPIHLGGVGKQNPIFMRAQVETSGTRHANQKKLWANRCLGAMSEEGNRAKKKKKQNSPSFPEKKMRKSIASRNLSGKSPGPVGPRNDTQNELADENSEAKKPRPTSSHSSRATSKKQVETTSKKVRTTLSGRRKSEAFPEKHRRKASTRLREGPACKRKRSKAGAAWRCYCCRPGLIPQYSQV